MDSTLLTMIALGALAAAAGQAAHWRDVTTGREIPTETYADHPFLVASFRAGPPRQETHP